MASCSGDHVLVLAAGRGTRMGTPKALLHVAGRHWWRYQRQRLREVGVRDTWVVSDAVRNAMTEPDIPERLVVANPTRPMFDSLVRGLESLAYNPPENVFVLPVDTPAPNVAVFRALHEKEGVAVPTIADRRGHPVKLPWRWICTRILTPEHGGRALPLFGDDRRLDRLIKPDLTEVPVNDTDAVTNLNTPEDLENWTCPGLASD